MIALPEGSRPRRDSLSARRLSGSIFATDALALALTASADGALLVERHDEGAVITWSNESARTFFGRSLSDRPSLGPLLLDAGDETAARRLLVALDSDNSARVECPVARADGVHWGEWSVSPVSMEDGAPARWLVTVRDITDRRRRDHALNIYLRETEQSRADARAQAQQAEALVNELTLAGGQAEAVILQRSAFLASVSHEIRTPLNGVIGLTGVLLGTGLSVEQREIADAVRGSAERLLGLLNDVLDFAKMDTGRMPLESVEFDVHETIEQIVELLAVRPDAHQLRVNTLIAPGVPSIVCGDPGRFGQVLSNLVGNAVKFTPAGQVTVRASIDAMDDKQVVLRCEIADTGIGIDADALERLFEPFVQADASTTRRYGGSGLGLAICKELVHLMGGTIGVRSAPGDGSVFWFTVRLTVSASARNSAPRPRADLPCRRALVIDPSRESRAIFALQLGGLGVVCDGASSLADAAARLSAATEPYALVFVHQDCPDAEPLHAARVIRDQHAAHAATVILLAPLGASPPQAALNAAGVSGLIHTPVRPSMLAGHLAAATRTRHGTATSRQALAEVDLDESTPRWRTAPRVLVAEDNVINQQVARHLLLQLGCSVDVVADGTEALDALANVRYDLVFMDCMMPECDGYEATRRLRRGGSARDRVPVIAMTANAMPGDRQRCLDAGMNDYLSKPVHSDELQAMLGRFLPALLQIDDGSACVAGKVPERRVTREVAVVIAADADEAVVDAKIVASLKSLQARSDRQTLIADLLAVFRVQAEEIGDHLRTALDEADLPRVREVAHKFKGSCASIGAARLAARAREAEFAAREGRLADAASACMSLGALVSRDVLALEAVYRDAIH